MGRGSETNYCSTWPVLLPEEENGGEEEILLYTRRYGRFVSPTPQFKNYNKMYLIKKGAAEPIEDLFKLSRELFTAIITLWMWKT